MRWLIALCLVVSGVCQARPFDVSDLTALESYGQVIVAPQPRLLLVERRRRYDSAGDYSAGPLTPRMLSRIMVADLDRPVGLTPLFAQGGAAGYWMGSVSPGGSRLSVFRLRRGTLSLGIVNLTTRQARWFAVRPDLPLAAPAPTWIDDDHLLVVAMPHSELPQILTLESATPRDQQRLWARAAAGRRSSATVAYSRKPAWPADATRALVRIDIRDGRATRLFDGDIVDVAASSDGSHVAVIAAGMPRQPAAGTIDTGFIARQHALSIVDVSSGAARTIVGDVLPGFLRWSPDGGRVLAFAPTPDLRGGHFVTIGRRGNIGTLAHGGAAIVTTEQSAIVVHAAWLGDAVMALVEGPAGSRWMRIDRPGPLPALPTDAVLVGDEGKRLWFLGDDALLTLDRELHVSVVARHIRQVGATSLDPSSIGYRVPMNPNAAPSGWVEDHAGLATVRNDAGMPLAPLTASADVLAITHDAAISFDVDPHGGGRLSLLALGRHLVLDRINRRLADLKLPVATRLDIDGRHHWLFLPDNVPHAPLVVVPYPGQQYGPEQPSSTNPAMPAIPANVPLLTAAGYAVLLPSLPAMQPGAPSAPLVAAIEAATDAAIATGTVDSARMAMLGHSFGAYTAMLMATRSVRFRAIIASSGPYDLASAHASMAGPDRLRLLRGLPFASSAGWAEGGQAQLRAPPTAAVSDYVAASPMFAADRVTAAVMLIHGDADTVGIDQAEHMFMELSRHGADATLVRYWGEGHVLTSPANIRDYWSRVIAFLGEHLDVTPPSPAPTPRN